MGSLRNDRRNRRLSLVAGIGLALAASTALSDAPKKNEAQPGLLSYPNVKVINAPELADKAKPSVHAVMPPGAPIGCTWE